MYNDMLYLLFYGFQGCMAFVDFNGRRFNLFREVEKIYYGVEEGC